MSDPAQTAEFFAAAWDQYEGIDSIDREVAVVLEGPGTVWADVTWSYRGRRRERFCYQLVARDDEFQIAVLTTLE